MDSFSDSIAAYREILHKVSEDLTALLTFSGEAKEFLHFLAEFTLRHLSTPNVALFQFEQNELLLDGGRWVIPNPQKQSFTQLGYQALERNEVMAAPPFLLFPLHKWEKKSQTAGKEFLPLGVIVLDGSSLSYDEKFLAQEIFRFFSLQASRLFRKEHLEVLAETLTSKRQSLEESLKDRQKISPSRSHFDPWVGRKSKKTLETLELLDKIIPSSSTVLITGESGTGKELVAQMIHQNGPLREKPLIGVHSGLLRASVLDSQLFGHRKGAFTGATDDQSGIFVQADGGTVFLDEIGEMPLDAQSKLLRVLQNGEVKPLGSNETVKVKVRIITTTQYNLEERVKQGTFRKDLFYRINTLALDLPPLRERKEDIPALVQHFLKDLARQRKEPAKKISSRALQALCAARWPGNILQLKNLLEQVCLLNSAVIISLKNLPREFRSDPADSIASYQKAKIKFMKRYLDHLLEAAGGRVIEAAKMAEIQKKSFYRILEKYS